MRQLLELGVDVLVEKPFVTSSADAVELSELAGRLGRRLGVSHNMSFDRNFVALRDDVHAGRFGRIDHVDVLCIRPFWPLRSGPYTGWLFADRGNPLIELGPHSASMLLDLTGVPDVLTTRDRRSDRADTDPDVSATMGRNRDGRGGRRAVVLGLR